MGQRHPYEEAPSRAIWRRAVSDRRLEDLGEWHSPKFDIHGRPIATIGSCFAQHIARALRSLRYPVLDTEPAPRALTAESRQRFGFEVYSARYGNVYTARQMLQLFDRATGAFVPSDHAWPLHGGFVDPFRPAIEPGGFDSVEAVAAEREGHLARVNELFSRAGVWVMTLGLTEAWVADADDAVFPLAPGVAGGTYDPARYRWVTFSFADVVADLEGFFGRVRSRNPAARFIVTVSPVPLAATASGQHVVVATMASKATLRAACAYVAGLFDFVDYFPAFEIIAGAQARGAYFAADARTVTATGAARVIEAFVQAYGLPAAEPLEAPAADVNVDVACEEALLSTLGDSSCAS